jgi:hypothetical protein
MAARNGILTGKLKRSTKLIRHGKVSVERFDGFRAVDVLEAHPNVDAERIGAIGHSLGGKQVLFVMAFDPRIKAGVSSDGGIGLQFSNWDADWYLSQEVHSRKFENNQVLAMIAPRAFLLVGGKYDDDRAWPFIAGAVPLWGAKRAPENVGWFRHDRGHCRAVIAPCDKFSVPINNEVGVVAGKYELTFLFCLPDLLDNLQYHRII